MSNTYKALIFIIVVVLLSIYIVVPNSPGIPIGQNPKKFETRLGLDLVGGVQALLEADLPAGTAIDADAMRNATAIVENRVNGLGVNEAVVQQAGDRRIVVELPGETDPEKALAVLKQTGLLEFVDFSQLSQQEIQLLMNAQVPIKTDYRLASEGSPEAPEAPTPETPSIATTETVTSTEEVTDPIASLENTVFPTIMTGAELKTANVTTNQANQYEISFELTDKGAQIFADFTKAHVNDVLAIVLDKQIISAPVIQSAIPDGKGVIQGNFTQESANALAVQLRYGSLPIPLSVVETRTVGPTLGQDSLRKSLLAGLVGFIIVVLFMTIYYRLPGAFAILAVFIYALITFAIFRGIPVTLTLAGIAGFLLSTGSALDANILIFERIKEELRAGKNLNASLELAFKRARPAIIDSNVATLITCSILFWFGSTFGATIVKGFSITLAIGVCVSLFTALVVTRTIMTLALSNFKSTDYAKWFGI